MVFIIEFVVWDDYFGACFDVGLMACLGLIVYLFLFELFGLVVLLVDFWWFVCFVFCFVVWGVALLAGLVFNLLVCV